MNSNWTCLSLDLITFITKPFTCTGPVLLQRLLIRVTVGKGSSSGSATTTTTTGPLFKKKS